MLEHSVISIEPMQNDAVDQKIIDRGYLINFTQRNYDVAETIRVIPIEKLLTSSVSGLDGVLLK